jgi:hypothetical protein
MYHDLLSYQPFQCCIAGNEIEYRQLGARNGPGTEGNPGPERSLQHRFASANLWIWNDEQIVHYRLISHFSSLSLLPQLEKAEEGSPDGTLP